MDLTTALTVFGRLEEARDTEWEGDPPVYEVRLIAGISPARGERTYMVRAGASRHGGGLARDEWQYVIETATEFDCELQLDNAAMVLG